MKKVIGLLVVAILIIGACMIYILNKGVSLRLAPVIGPTLLEIGAPSIARSVVVRLTPELQMAEYMIIGLNPENTFATELIERMKTEYKNDFGVEPQILADNAPSNIQIEQCSKPCWIIIGVTEANELSPNAFIEERIKPTNKPYFNLTFLDFDRNVTVPEDCNVEQRVSYDCVVPLAVRDSKKKIKSEKKYFFVRKYNVHDYFFLVENQRH